MSNMMFIRWADATADVARWSEKKERYSRRRGHYNSISHRVSPYKEFAARLLLLARKGWKIEKAGTIAESISVIGL